MKIKQLALFVALGAMLASCSGHKTVLPYFTDIQTTATGEFPAMEYMPVLQPDDELAITVTSEDPRATAAYNLPMINPATSDEIARTTSPRTLTYRVDSKGDIDFPILGTIHAAGLTTEGLKEYLVGRLTDHVADPQVTVTLMSFNVVVAGEVTTPKRINVSSNRFSVLDALTSAGDLTPYGERENVLVIREVDGKRQYAHLNLNSSDILTSPYFYLQPNDYIYVAPNKVRQANSKYNQDNAFKLSVISTVVSAASVIASLVIALTVK